MANRIPLVIDALSQRIKELPSGDNLDLTGNGISAVRNIIPETDVTYDLGSSSKRFRDLYLSGNSIFMGESTISYDSSDNQLSFQTANGSPINVDLSGNTTSDLAEGSNLYFTVTRAQNAISVDSTLDKVGGQISASRIRNDLTAETTARESAVSLLTTNLNSEISRATAAESALGVRIDNVLSNIDPAALDSLTEIVSAFQSADNNINQAITTLATDLSADLLAETNRALAAESSLSSSLTAEISRALDAESSLSSSLTAETNRALAAESILQNNIDSEETARIAADNTLQSNINSEATTRQAADTTLTNNLNSEISRAQAAEAALGVRIDNVLSNIDPTSLDSLTEIVSAFQSADSTINGAITALSNGLSADISDEASTRADADADLQANIDDEQSERVAADNTLQSNIDNEAAIRESAINTLTNDLNSEISRATAAETSIASDLADEISRATAAETALSSTIAELSVSDISGAASITYVDDSIANLIDSAPGALNTLNELAAALGNDENYAVSITTSLGTKADKTTNIVAGTGLVGGGDLSASRTLSLDTSGVTAGSYGSSTSIPTITVDEYGRVINVVGNSVTFPTNVSEFANDVGYATISGSETLTNKTLSNSVITGTLTAGGTVGSNNQVLTSTGNGVEWRNAAGGSGGMGGDGVTTLESINTSIIATSYAADSSAVINGFKIIGFTNIPLGDYGVLAWQTHSTLGVEYHNDWDASMDLQFGGTLVTADLGAI